VAGTGGGATPEQAFGGPPVLGGVAPVPLPVGEPPHQVPRGQFLDGRVDLRGADAVPPRQRGEPRQPPARFVMDERGGEPVSEDRGGRRPAARAATALLVAEHGGHFSGGREIATTPRPGTLSKTSGGGTASQPRPDPTPPGPARMHTLRLPT